MSEKNADTIIQNFDSTSHWLYSDIRQIIILPSALTNIIDFVHEIETVTEEGMLISIIEKCMESLFSIQANQRIKLLDFIIDKISSIIDTNTDLSQLKYLVTLAYCIMIIAYRDQNRFNGEVNEIKSLCSKLNENILKKISIETESNECLIHFYLFVNLVVRQLSLWVEFNNIADVKLQSISIDKKSKKRKDCTSKSLIFLYNKLSLPLNEISFHSQRPIHYLSLLSFYSLISLESLQQEFNKSIRVIKRQLVRDNNETSPKRLKSDIECDTPMHSKLAKLVLDITEKRDIANSELIIIFEKTEEILLLSEKEYKSNGIGSENYESVFINLIKLWTFGIKQKLMTQFDYNMYYIPLVTTEIQGKSYKIQIKAILDFIMAFQSKLIVALLNNPSWLCGTLMRSIECLVTNSTNDKNLTDQERSEIVDLINEVGKLLEVLLQAKNLHQLCHMIVLIPHSLFTFISELKSPLYPEVRRVLAKNIVHPIITVLNKHTLDHLKMELKGAAREVCREFLEIK